jgi:hypothetical protein
LTAKAVRLLGAGQAIATQFVSSKVAALTEGVAKTMLLNKIKGVTVALAVAFTANITPPIEAEQHIYLFGRVAVERDGTIEVRGGGVRLVNDASHEETEIRSNRLVIKKDWTIYALGAATMMTKPSRSQEAVP